MQAHPTPEQDPQRTPALFWWLLLASIPLALVPTLWTGLDFAAAGLFIGKTPSLHSDSWFWVELLNLYVPAVFRVMIITALLLWITLALRKKAARWKLPLAFLVFAGILGPGLVVNMGFKDNWQRARPYMVQEFGGTQQFTRAAVITDQCDSNCSFVSGHVACGVFLASLMLVFRKQRFFWAVTGVLAGWLIGFARMSAGAHWLSDVLWAFPVTLMCSWVVWKLLLLKFTPPSPAVLRDSAS
jgi:lipid A 4'-phosphatase